MNQSPSTLWHSLTKVSYFSLILLLIFWYEIFQPAEQFNSHIITLIVILPLLFPMHGIMKKKIYTYAWSQFINMIYFCHGVLIAMTSDEGFGMAIAEIIIVLSFFTFATIAIRKEKPRT